MHPITAIGLILLGLAFLAGGGESLVRGATGIARLAGVTPAVIGLTVVAIGTSTPELVVSFVAAMRGQSEIAVANVVGSSIFNITLTLGVTAMIFALPVRGSAVRMEWPFMFAATCACLLAMRDGMISRIEAGIFVTALILFMGYAVRLAKREVTSAEVKQHTQAVEDRVGGPVVEPRALGAVVLLTVGLFALIVGGRLLLEGATTIARMAGMTERVIGLTVVAAGTGMPELATCIIAVRRNQPDVAVANMIGSNIFNILGILGITALIRPIPISAAMLGSDMVWMLGATILLYPILVTGMRISRWQGALLAAVYGVYLVLLLTPGFLR
ncbi:MAG: calcium/sodium antiporter [Longimicrobiales bacterium]